MSPSSALTPDQAARANDPIGRAMLDVLLGFVAEGLGHLVEESVNFDARDVYESGCSEIAERSVRDALAVYISRGRLPSEHDKPELPELCKDPGLVAYRFARIDAHQRLVAATRGAL
jgi:hypothetical protein